MSPRRFEIAQSSPGLYLEEDFDAHQVDRQYIRFLAATYWVHMLGPVGINVFEVAGQTLVKTIVGSKTTQGPADCMR